MISGMFQFTILQSVYKNDKPEFLDQCFESIKNNSLQPVKIVLVKDGPISIDLDSIISKWLEKLPIQVVGYEQNQGLAYALNYGLQFVETELVARMDSDDICYFDRFEKQINYLMANPKISLLSGYIDEFNFDFNIIASTRTVPLENTEIANCLKKRNAFNHMAVMFKKSAIVESGGYQEVPYFEDYDLWVRIVQKGFLVANIPEKLVKARIGNDMIGRRHGFAYAKHEIFFLKRQLERGFVSKQEYCKLVLLRVPVRLLPKWGLKIVYKFLRG